MDMLRAGAISFSLTIVNIVCIIIVAAVMFKVPPMCPPQVSVQRAWVLIRSAADQGSGAYQGEGLHLPS